ncbi:MAG: glycosyltransferase family 4 protein [Desulfuromonadales bacterium]|nr:glycosyltransferase family 4 protein [Desulfuromonadales bacterium]
MRLLIVVPDQDRATGNWVTATRLQHGLAARGHDASICAAGDDPEKLRAAVTAAAPELVLLLHAWRSGRPWLDMGSPRPYAVLLTGTDVNAGMTDPAQAPVIATILQHAAAILSQNPLTVAALQRDQPLLAARVHYLPPGITLGNTPFPLWERLAATPGELFCLCPAGIRPVKGQVELLGMCAPLIAEGQPLRMAFCGPVLDHDYGRRLFEAIEIRPWATYLGIVPPDAMPDAMRRADVIISNSFSEGLPNALVEATALGRPIVAHDIPGNAAVVTDGVNGLLYRDGSGFRTAIRRLQNDPALAASLSHPDPGRFSSEREAFTLEALCREILQNL